MAQQLEKISELNCSSKLKQYTRKKLNYCSSKLEEYTPKKLDYCSSKLEEYTCKKCPFKTNLKILYFKHFDYCPQAVIFIDYILENECELCKSRSYSNFYHRVHKRRCERFRKLTKLKTSNNITVNAISNTSSTDMLECEYCAFKSKEISEITKHKSESHECTKCNFTTNLKSELVAHATNHVNGCPHCSYKSKRNINLKHHIQVMHPEIHAVKISDGFNCRFCQFTCSSRILLQHHYRLKHMTEEKFKCKKCDYKAKSQYFLEKHKGIVHSTDVRFELNEVGMLCCDRCTFQTQNRHGLIKHYSVSHDVDVLS